MNKLNNRKFIYIILSVMALILNVLPIIISDVAAITKYSIVSIAFAICSVIYTVIAFIFKNHGNLFVAGKYWIYRVLSFVFSENESYAKDEEYKKEFELSAFIYCVTIPTYITLAFFAHGFFSSFLQAFRWTIIRLIAIIIPHIIKRIKAKKQQHIKDEADRKEQERRESMGKWK